MIKKNVAKLAKVRHTIAFFCLDSRKYLDKAKHLEKEVLFRIYYISEMTLLINLVSIQVKKINRNLYVLTIMIYMHLRINCVNSNRLDQVQLNA